MRIHIVCPLAFEFSTRYKVGETFVEFCRRKIMVRCSLTSRYILIFFQSLEIVLTNIFHTLSLVCFKTDIKIRKGRTIFTIYETIASVLTNHNRAKGKN